MHFIPTLTGQFVGDLSGGTTKLRESIDMCFDLIGPSLLAPDTEGDPKLALRLTKVFCIPL